MIIVDFDGTLVNENSSRVFERVVCQRNHGSRILELWHLAFFRNPIVSFCFRATFAVFGITAGRRDLRLAAFLAISRRLVGEREIQASFLAAAGQLTANQEVAEYLSRQTEAVAILSNGLREIIERHSPLPVIAASSFSAKTVQSMKKKMELLEGLDFVDYLTDDIAELRYLPSDAFKARKACEGIYSFERAHP